MRGDVEIVTAGALTMLDRMAQEYDGVPAYYGHVAPSSLAGLETRTTLRRHARRVSCDAIHR